MTLDDQIAEKLPLIRRVAKAFSRRTPMIEYDDAVQVVSIAAWRILIAPKEAGDDVDGAIAFYGYNRLIDVVRTGRTGGLTRTQLREGGHELPYSLNTLMEGGEGKTEWLEMLEDPDGDSHERALNERIIGEAMSALPERIRLVIWLRFFEDLKLVEIAEMFGVTESRISQLATKGLMLMRLTIASAAA